MRILCDQNVPAKYLAALTDVDRFTVQSVDTVLQHDATDTEIATYAETDGWVVFTSDTDFYIDGRDHGLLLYSQIEDPSPGAVVDAVDQIARAYESSREIVETVLTDGYEHVGRVSVDP